MEDEIAEHRPSTMFAVAAIQGQLLALQAKYNSCLKDNAALRKLLEEGKEDQADIYYYLQKKLDDNYNNISELELQIVEEQSDREKAEQAYEARIQELESQIMQMREKYEETIRLLEDRVLALKRFEERRAEIEAEHKKALQEAEAEKQRAREMVTEVERKCIRDKENLKREMLIKIQETKSSLLAMASEKLDEITKRTILENDQLKMELRFQNKESERVVAKIKKTEAENQELRYLLNLSKHTEVEMTRKLGSYSRMFKQQHQQQLQPLDGRSVASSPALGIGSSDESLAPSEPARPSSASVAGPPSSSALPVIRTAGMALEAGSGLRSVSAEEVEECSVVSFGTIFLANRGGVMTRTIGCQTVTSKLDDAMDTLGKSYIRPRQTYPHSWTGRAAPPPKHPTLTAPGKKGRSSKKDAAGPASSDPPLQQDGHGGHIDDASSIGSRSVMSQVTLNSHKSGRSRASHLLPMPLGKKIRLKRPEPPPPNIPIEVLHVPAAKEEAAPGDQSAPPQRPEEDKAEGGPVSPAASLVAPLPAFQPRSR